MAVEMDELKLTVALDDQASAGLGNLQKSLQGIVTAVGPAQAGLKQLGQSLRGAGGHARGLHGSLGGLAARGGFIGGFFFEIGRQAQQMAKEFAEAALDIKAYADTMVSLDQVSKRTATSMGQFRANVAVFRESGLGQEEASKMLSGYASALADLQRPGSRLVQDLLSKQTGVYRERMEDLIRTIMTSSQTQGINAIRAAGRAIREEHERRGQPERGAEAEATFFARLGMPGLEKVRGHLHEISAEEERMYNDRRKDAERYQTALEKQSDAWERSVQAVQSIAFQLFPIAAGAEGVAGFFGDIQKGVEAIDKSMRNTNSEIDKQRSEAARTKVVTPEGKEITAQEGLSEDEKRREILRRKMSPRRSTTTRPGEELPRGSDVNIIIDGKVKNIGTSTDPTGMDIEFDPLANTLRRYRPGSVPGYGRRASLLGGEVSTGDGGGDGGSAGGPLDLSSIPSIGELLKPDPNAIVAPIDPGQFAGTGWRGLPMSKNIIDLRGDTGSQAQALLGEQSERMELLTDEVSRLNEFLAPELMRMLLEGTGAPAFHNAPMGGAAGESNPIQPPAGSLQPGGGAASEAVQAARDEKKSRIATAMSEAMKYIGKNESKHQADLKDFMNTGGRNLSRDDAAWCARFTDAVLTRAGLPSLESTLPEGQKAGQKDDRTWSSLAYKNYGRGVTPDEDIREGDVFVKERKGGGHVGVATGNYRINPETGQKEYEMLSGNIGGKTKGGGEVNLTWETVSGRSGEGGSGKPGEKVAGAGHGDVISVRRGEKATEIADTGPQEGAGKGKRLDDVTAANAPGAEVTDTGITDVSGVELIAGKKSLRDRARQALKELDLPNREDPLINPAVEELKVKQRAEELKAKQRAVEKIEPGSEEEWELRRQEALKNEVYIPGKGFASGYSEKFSAQPPEGYGPGSGLPAPGQIEKTIREGGRREGKTDEEIRKSEEFYSDPDRLERQQRDRYGTPGEFFNPQTGAPQGRPISFQPGSALDQPDGSILDRAATSGIDVNQNGKLTVDVNAPAGTSVSAEGDGVFNKTETNRSVPMEPTQAEI